MLEDENDVTSDVEYEADRKEFMAILAEITGLELKVIQQIEINRAKAYARLLAGASDHRIELWGGIIATARFEREQKGIGPGGKEFVEPEHYRINMKAHYGLLTAFEKELGKECKNG
jgi:hypothetical protein